MVVGEASNGPETITRLEKDPADILFLDLAMPEMDGVKVIEALREKNIPTKVIVFTVFDSDERIIQAVPEWKEADIWFCGPTAFGETLHRDLVEKGLSSDDFHQELFDMR